MGPSGRSPTWDLDEVLHRPCGIGRVLGVNLAGGSHELSKPDKAGRR
jgi:hypothetical protein